MDNEELKKRHQSEIDFHEKKYAEEKKKTIYDIGFTDLILNDMLSKLGDLTDKKVVDFGCGSGWLAEILLQKGAEVWAFDISEEAVRKTSEVAEKLGLSERLHVDVMPAENLSYKDNSFDVVVGVGILHHLELNLAAKEIHRVLKKGGSAYFMEPLGHNPLVNLYRNRTPELRSPDEAPLRYDDFKLFENIFSVFEHRDFYLLTLLSLFWHYVLKNQELMMRARSLLFKVDKLFLRLLPCARKYCWYSVLVMQK